MRDGNGDEDWRERMRRMEEAMERNWAEHDRIRDQLEAAGRDIIALHASMKTQRENIDKLLGALRDLIDRIPPENLR